MAQERIADYLKSLTPQARGNLLNELERLELCGVDMPGIEGVLEVLRAEFRQGAKSPNKMAQPARYFFAPLDPFLVDGDPNHPNPGRLSRGSLPPIWEWISRDLLPTMARDYAAQLKGLVASDKKREARQAASTFQTKVVKSLENTFASSEATEQARTKLATFTASHSIFGDLSKMVCVLRAREALTKLSETLPDKIAKLDDPQAAALEKDLDAVAKITQDAVPFALTLVATRLKTPWQLMRFATKATASKEAADIAATPYAVAVTMVLDQIDDKKLALRFALKNERILLAKEILIRIYDTETALQTHIDGLAQSEWGIRLATLMDAIAKLVDAEVSRFPGDVGHILGSRSLRGGQSLTAKLSQLAWKGRDAVKGLIGQT